MEMYRSLASNTVEMGPTGASNQQKKNHDLENPKLVRGPGLVNTYKLRGVKIGNKTFPEKNSI